MNQFFGLVLLLIGGTFAGLVVRNREAIPGWQYAYTFWVSVALLGLLAAARVAGLAAR